MNDLATKIAQIEARYVRRLAIPPPMRQSPRSVPRPRRPPIRARPWKPARAAASRGAPGRPSVLRRCARQRARQRQPGAAQYHNRRGRHAAGWPAAVSTSRRNPRRFARRSASYLGTLLERYRFLSLQGLGTGGVQQMRVELNAVFINLQTNVLVGQSNGAIRRKNCCYAPTASF